MTTPYSTAKANMTNDERDSFSEFEGAVNDVIETLINGVRGFAVAADKADGQLAQELVAMGAQRRSTTEDIIRIAADEDMSPVTLDDEGTAPGVLHRSWISIRDAVEGDSGVVAAALNGEQHAKDDLQDAIDGGLPEPITTVARRALGEIEANISKLEAMKG